MSPDTILNRQLWRWYVVLFIANELDLLYTYFGLGRGFFQEANPLLRPHLYTWWPITIKAVALAGLGLGIAAAVHAGFHRRRHVLTILRGAAAIYGIVLILHLVVLIRAMTRG